MHGAHRNACILFAKNADALVHARAYATVQKFRCHGSYCESILSLARAFTGCRLPPALLLSRRNQSPDAVHSRNPSKSTLDHEAVATAVSHKHHSIINVDVGLIQSEFVYGSNSKRGHGASEAPTAPSGAPSFEPNKIAVARQRPSSSFLIACALQASRGRCSQKVLWSHRRTCTLITGRVRLTTEQAITIFRMRRTKTVRTASRLATKYGITPKANAPWLVRDLYPAS